METKRIVIEDRNHIKDEELKEAAGILRSGGLVAFPTETVYGLGGNALDEDAARKIYAAKGRPSDNPLIAHVSCVEEVEPLVKEIPEAGRTWVLVAAAVLALVAACVYLSYRISVRILESKEF